jgi:D-3-phosphoglycerate dehydrogenase
MKKVLLPQKICNEGLDVLKGRVEVVIADDPSQETISPLMKDVSGVILRTTSRITRQMILSAPNLEVISRTGVGVDNIDVKAASENGVTVCNLPGLNNISVAEQAVSLLVGLAKALPFLDAAVRECNWSKRNANKSTELHGKTLGVIGFGRIGSHVAGVMSNGFGMKVLAYDPYVSTSDNCDVAFCDLEEVLMQSDFVTIHLPATAETQGLLNRERLAMMKPSAYLINTARGTVTDETALIELLREKKIAGAGLDVFAVEPLPGDHPFTKMDNVLLSPHAAALTRECVIRAAVEAAQAVLDV